MQKKQTNKQTKKKQTTKQKGVCFKTLLNDFGKIYTKSNHFKGEVCINQFSSKIYYLILKVH